MTRAASLAVAALVAGVASEISYPLVPREGRTGLAIATVLLFFVAAVAHCLARWGFRRGAVAIAAVWIGGLVADIVGVHTGFPFGSYSYTGALGPRLGDVPVLIGCAWTMMAYPAWIVAGVLVPSRGRRFSFPRIAVGGWALASWDLFLDPQMVDAGLWRWRSPEPGLPGADDVPLTNYLGWVGVALLLMLVLAVLSPGETPGGRVVPLTTYLWTYFSSVIAHLAFFGLPVAAGWGALGMGLVAIPAAMRLVRRRTTAASTSDSTAAVVVAR